MQHPFLAAIGSGLFLTAPIAIGQAQASPALQGIELTPIQQRKLTVLSAQTLTEVRAVLSPAQRGKFNRSLATGAGLKKSLLDSNLSLSQKLQLRSLLAPKQQQLETILTPEQQQQARNNVSTQR
jgi:periplasmic protein CpxP/Spy